MYDEMGKVLKTALLSKGITTEGIIEEDNRPTTVKTRIYAHDQQVVRYDREEKTDISRSAQSRILEFVRSSLPYVKAVILSDYCKGVITRSLIKKLLELTGTKLFIAADPKIGHFDYYKGVSLITPNIHEASFGSGIKITDDVTLREAGKILMKKLRLKALLITRGERGMTLFEKSGKIVNIPTLAKEVYDVTGAGDTVIAAFTLSYASGMDFREAAEIANHAAGIVVGERGTAVVTRKEIFESMKMNKYRSHPIS
jgi:D-beta-D-heptose 7-phosphate kinase/D-beta-D-heptose 1-phosphate adenosyltransferase